mgnify:CR=1 FL=1
MAVHRAVATDEIEISAITRRLACMRGYSGRLRTVQRNGHDAIERIERRRPPVGFSGAARQGQPAEKALRKHEKSRTFRTGAVVEPSQLARGSPEAKRLRKQEKSSTLSVGEVVEQSQLA